MRTPLTTALFLTAFLLGTPAMADPPGELIWKSPYPTGSVVNMTSGETLGHCHATLRLITDADGSQHEMYNQAECPSNLHAHNYLSISVPVGEPIQNMDGYREARHVKILANGIIKLY